MKLVEDLLKIKTADHSKIQAWIKWYFYDLGYYSRTEKEVWRNRKGRNVTAGNPEALRDDRRKSRVSPRECLS